jgi:hypothetical protein
VRPAQPAPPPAQPPNPQAQPAHAPWPEPIVDQVQMVVSWIEGRPLSRAEILQLLTHVLRQHSIPRRRKIDHTVAWLNEHPP